MDDIEPLFRKRAAKRRTLSSSEGFWFSLVFLTRFLFFFWVYNLVFFFSKTRALYWLKRAAGEFR